MKRLLIILMILPMQILFSGTTGKIAGRIVDAETGEPLIGANVYIEELNTGGSTDVDGYYYIINIPPGKYVVKASFLGYGTKISKNVEVQVDRTTELNFSLSSKALEGEEVIVQAEKVEVQRDRTSTMQDIDADELDQLPVNTVQGVLELQSGVVNSGGLHLRGGRAGEVAYFIDGYRIEDPLFNGEVVEINNQAIQQMELLSGTFNAEYGNALSGVVNIVTKENFSKLTGNFTYKRTNIGLEDASNNLNENYYEGYINGPLWKESPVGVLLSGKYVNADNYYYSGKSRVYEDETGKLNRESIEFSEDEPFGYDENFTMLGKLYFRPFSSGKITLLYNYGDREWQNYVHTLRFIPDSSYIRSSNSKLIGLNFTHALSKNLFYDLRFSHYNYEYKRTIGDLHYTEYPIPLYLRFDNSRFYRSLANSVYEDQTTQTISAKADLTWQIDRYNLVKAGFDFKSYKMDYFYISNPNNPNARFEIDYDEKPYEGAFYVQDKIEFETIILNLGLRYDFYDPKSNYVSNPFDDSSIKESETRTSLSPRLGIAYPVRDNMVFHFAYGQFFQRPEFQVMYENLDRTFGVNEPLFGNPDLKPEKTSSYEFGLHTTFGSNFKLQTTFFSKKIENLIGILWTYQPLPYAEYVNEDFANVKGFEISTRLSLHNISFSANYTYSIAEGSSSSQQERYSGAFDVVGKQSLKFLPLNFDQRHTANGQVSIYFSDNEGPFGFMPGIFENTNLQFIMKYGSGLPYTFNPARSRYVADRNNSTMESTFFADLKVRKDFYIDDYYISVFADIRNLFDTKNIRSVYSATGKPDESGSLLKNITEDYDQDPLNYYAPRTIYLGVNFGF